jgi:hypothetical protein
MRQDEHLLPSRVRGLVVKSGADISGAILLAGFEDQHPDTSADLSVLFDPGMQELLHPVEQQRLNAACLGADLQTAGSGAPLGIPGSATKQMTFVPFR